MKKDSKLIILGCGGHARSVADVALSIGVKEIIFVDEFAKKGEKLLGFSVQSFFPEIAQQNWFFISAYGDPLKRQQAYEIALKKRFQSTSIISKASTIGAESRIEEGCFIGHHAHIGPKATIGKNCIINTAAIVEHDTEVGEYTHISVHATLCGRVKIGERCFVGAGAIVIDGIQIEDDIIIGAGGVVTNCLKEPATYKGIPAR